MSLISPSPNPVEAAFVPIQYYTNTDLYNYQVDNRPLQDIATNQTVLATGIDQNSLAIHSLTQNAQQGTLNYGADSGAANAYVVTLTPAPTAYSAGMVVNVGTISASNTGASTVNVNGLGVLPILGPGGAALQGGEIVAGSNIGLQINPALSAAELVYTSGGIVSSAFLGGNKVVFTSNGSWTVPVNVTQIWVSGCAGGGGGGGGGGSVGSTGNVGSGGGGGGGAGQFILKTPFSVTPGHSLAAAIGGSGAGGGRGASTGASGASGSAAGNTTLTDSTSATTILTLTGGGGGGGGAGQTSTSAAIPAGSAGGVGGSGYPSGSCGSDGNYTGNGGPGASGPFGGGGGLGRAASATGINAYAAVGYGGGGGGGGGTYGTGAYAGGAGSVGAPGILIIEW